MHFDSINEPSHPCTSYSNSGRIRVFHWDRKAQLTFILMYVYIDIWINIWIIHSLERGNPAHQSFSDNLLVGCVNNMDRSCSRYSDSGVIRSFTGPRHAWTRYSDSGIIRSFAGTRQPITHFYWQ